MKRHPALRKLIKELKDAGCEVVQVRRSSHLKIYYQGRMVGSMSGNFGGDWHDLDNLRSDLKDNGVPL